MGRRRHRRWPTSWCWRCRCTASFGWTHGLSGKLVIDAMNYWPPTDGTLPLSFDDEDIGTSEVVAERLNNAAVVKTLNHVGYHELESYARPHGFAGSARAWRCWR